MGDVRHSHDRIGARIFRPRRAATFLITLVTAAASMLVGALPAAAVDTCVIVPNPTPLLHTECFGLNLAGTDLADRDLSYANLAGTNLRNVNLANSKLANANLANATLQGARLGGAILLGATTTGANLNSLFVATMMPNGSINNTGGSLSVSPQSSLVANGLSKTFNAVGKYQNGSTVILRNNVAWTSSNTNVATVSSTGVATGVVPNSPFGLSNFPRSATIRATAGNKSAAASLVVGAPLPTSVGLTPPTAAVIVPGTQQFAVTITFSDASTLSTSSFPELKWSSSNTGVATVNNSGLATGVGPGTTTIKASLGSLSRTATLTVAGALAIPPTVLPDGTQGTPYSQTLAATGGTEPRTWSVSAGSLPAGLTLSSAGVLSGTPTAPETATFTVRVDTAAPTQSATRELSIRVLAPLAITTTELPDGTRDKAYEASLQSAGGEPPVAWSIVPGALPPGLSLNGSTGVISGTPTQAGSFQFTVRVADGQTTTSSKQLSIKINEPVTELKVVSNATGSGVTGHPFGPFTPIQVTSGGTPPYEWSVVTGNLPPGVALDPATGAVSGTPSAAGDFTFEMQVADSSSPEQAVKLKKTITVFEGLFIKTTGLRDGFLPKPGQSCPIDELNCSYSERLEGGGGGGSLLLWSVIPGSSLPPGLDLNASTGLISGNPSQAGKFEFTVELWNLNVAFPPVTRKFSITIHPEPPEFAPTIFPVAVVGEPYSFGPLVVKGASPEENWRWSVDGDLPAGLVLDPATGMFTESKVTGLTGAEREDHFPFDLHATANGVTVTGSYSIHVVERLSIDAWIPGGVVGSPSLFQLVPDGGVGPYQWSIVEGSLPAGLEMNSDGRVMGTPSVEGITTVKLRVTDNTFIGRDCAPGEPGPCLGQVATRDVRIDVFQSNFSGALTVTPDRLPTGAAYTPYDWTPTVTGGAAPYTWSIAGLPRDLSFNTATGQISGTTDEPGTYPVTITLTDNVGRKLAMFDEIVIGSALCLLCDAF